MTPVAQLLDQARQAHRRYRDASGRITKQGNVSHARDNQIATAAMAEALQARVDADSADPQRISFAWIDDERLMRASHDSLVQFYVKFLSPVEP